MSAAINGHAGPVTPLSPSGQASDDDIGRRLARIYMYILSRSGSAKMTGEEKTQMAVAGSDPATLCQEVGDGT